VSMDVNVHPAAPATTKRRQQTKKFAFHPLANNFPPIEGPEFDALVDDIATHGLHDPIVILDEQILDGRNRYRACLEAGVEPTFVLFEGDDPVAFVISVNVKRRHLDESRRAYVAALFAIMRQGERTDLPSNEGKSISQEQAAKLMNVGVASVERARAVLNSGTLELQHAVAQGKMAVSAAADIAKAEPEFQRAVVEKVETGVKVTEALRQLKKVSVAGKVEALPEGKFRVIYADPPWQYNDSRAGLDMASSAAESHYPTMPLEELKALDVKSLAADDSVLLCWATFPLLKEALELVESWGFTYKTRFVWDKVRPNFGHYHTARLELLLVCTRGACTPDADKRDDQLQTFTRGAHSAKPEEWRALIDRQWPHGPRVELFRRGDAPEGWTVWGNEAKQDVSEDL
jgi:N6-adenosine-specific RNA methylase IME4/ParB-like chromosome segregation protein Spo0J